MNINVILFTDFETLDVFGPVEVFGKVENYAIGYYSQQGGIVSNKDGLRIETQKIDDIKINDVLFIPGGLGTRKEVENTGLIDQIKQLAEKSRYVLTVCTGSALLARTGLLDGKKATSNKRAFDWVKSNSDRVNWIQQARWIVDGKYYTSSGVSAGIDMTLGFVSDLLGKNTAEAIAFRIEYSWQSDKQHDDFWKQ